MPIAVVGDSACVEPDRAWLQDDRAKVSRRIDQFSAQ